MDFDNSIFQVGSNVFELIEFTIHSPRSLPASIPSTSKNLETFKEDKTMTFAVNVAKIKEIIRLPTIQTCLSSCPEVLGVFNLRGQPVPIVHLSLALGLPSTLDQNTDQVIVTEFSGRTAGFIVGNAKRIRRESWVNVLPPSSDAFNSITGMIRNDDDKFIYILDFERILLNIETRSSDQSFNGSSTTKKHPGSFASNLFPDQRQSQNPDSSLNRNSLVSNRTSLPAAFTIFVVDDSATARKALIQMLNFKNATVLEFVNGSDFWDQLESGTFQKFITSSKCVIISDVEMPKMDGYSLCKKLQENDSFKQIPFILHSSLCGDVAKERAKAAGAKHYVTKFNRTALYASIEACLDLDLSTLAVGS